MKHADQVSAPLPKDRTPEFPLLCLWGLDFASKYLVPKISGKKRMHRTPLEMRKIA